MHSPAGMGIGFFLTFIEIVCMCAILCCGYGNDRAYPKNYQLLFIFTVCEAYSVSMYTARYDGRTVCIAALATAMVTIALTFYAFTVK